MASSPSRAAIAGIRHTPVSSGVHKPGTRVLMAYVGVDGRPKGELMEAVVIEWAPSRRYLKALIDPTRGRHMVWYDIEAQDLVCLEVLPPMELKKPVAEQGENASGVRATP